MSDKEFVRQHVPFKELKKEGFFDKNIKFNDYEKIVERFLKFFGKTKEQYINGSPIFNSELHIDNIQTGYFPGYVNGHGELKKGDSFHLTIV